MALSFMEMRGLQKQAAAIKDELKSGTLAFMDMRKKQRELAEVIAKIKGEAPYPTPDPQPEPAPQPEPEPAPATGPTLVERYQAGEFNGEDYPQFRQRVLEVEAAGAEFETLRDGVIAWAEANYQLFNDAA
ncbi:hypothetical protein ACEUCJ_15250 [Aeromonas rivipollensis]|uniref:hypothetical protein n=1 Tax=Aeromonas rivipollensis TaxID=948519 RepID=UPI0038D1BC7A